MLPMFMFDLIFLPILPRAFLEPPWALMLDCPGPWILKLICTSLPAVADESPFKLSAVVLPAELLPEALPEYAFGISRRICSRKGFSGPLAVPVAK